MPVSIFDSKAERKIYQRLKTVWSKYVCAYPQIPVRKVLGYDDLKGLPIPPGAIDYLLRTEFDFVICEKETDNPVLAIEFDGIGKGFSQNGRYVSRVAVLNDPYRKLKLDAKLRACELSGFPLVVVSFVETDLLEESENAITVLDGIIGEIRETIGLQHLVASHSNLLGDALSRDPSGAAADWIMSGLEVQSAYENNPLRRKSMQIRSKLPISGFDTEFLRDREGYIGVRRSFVGGWELSSNCHKQQILLAASVYMRPFNSIRCDAIAIADCVAEYCLATKARRDIGYDPAAWRKLVQETPWTTRSSRP